MNTWKPVVGIVLLFILGILIGSAGTIFYLDHWRRPLADPGARAAFIMKKLSKELELTKNQKIAVEKSVAQMTERLHEHFIQMRPEVKKIIDEGFFQIKQELNDSQKEKLDGLREQFEKQRRAGRRSR